MSKNPGKNRAPDPALGDVGSQLRSLLQALPDVVYFKDAFGRNLLINKAFEDMAGKPAEAIIGRTDEDLLPPDLAARCRESDTETMRSRDSLRFEEKSVKPDGRCLYYETIKTPVFGEADAVIGLVGVSRDITERKKAEEALRQSVREKETLLKETHHRVKNNMQIISSILNLQAKTVQDASALEALRMCQNRIRSMSLIHEMLYRSGDISSIDFGEYLRSLATTLFHSCRTDPGLVRLEFDTRPILLDINTAIPCGLIVNELLLNALKHAFPGGRSGAIRIGLDRDGDGLCALTVADTGIGFPGNLDFRKTESLGLQLVNLLVEQIGGAISMRTGEGTAFRLAFSERNTPIEKAD